MKFFLLFILLSLITVSTEAQINIRSVETYTVKDGLSQTSVHTIFKDSRGLLWLGTEGGLNKYDGYNITPYHVFGSNNILSSRGVIYDILEDKGGNIWYGSTGVLSKLNIHSETVDNLSTILKNKLKVKFGVVLTLFQDSKENIWFGTFGQGFFKISADFSKVQNYKNDPDSTGDSSLDYVRDFYEDDSGNIWIVTYGGIVKFNPQTEDIYNVFYEKSVSKLKHIPVLNIIPTNNNKLMLFTRGEGILIYDTTSDSLTDYDTKINRLLGDSTLRDASIDDSGRIWVSAYGLGVIVIDPETKSVQNLVSTVEEKYKRALMESLSLSIDPNGIAWIGTQHNGLLKLILGKKSINTVNSSINGYEEIDNNITNAVAQDVYGVIWFASNEGLFKIYPGRKFVKRLKLTNEFTPYQFKIYNIEFSENYAWLSFGSNLVKYELTKDEYDLINVEENGTITEVDILDKDNMVLGSASGNIYFYTPSNNEIKTIAIRDSAYSYAVIDCFLNDDSTLWIGTNNGLFFINLSDDSLQAQKSNLNLRLDYITSLTSINNEKLWFGTYGDGLFSYDINTAQLNHFTYQDGLPDNTVYGVMFDSQHRLWMSSNRGIFEFNTENKMVRTLDVTDGLQGFEYNSKAYSKSNTGELFYGGVNGFNYFNPDDIERNEIPPKILIDKVILFDSVVVKNISKGFNEIYEFSYDENSISFEFTALDFMNPAKNNYEYMLEGINKDWIRAGKKRYATFPNINPGEYKFSVRGTNSDQIYNKEGVSFSFIIAPPFWATWWFRTILISLTLIAVYSIYKFRMMNQDRRLREIEAIRKKIADDFHDDLGHKLTRISLYSEMIKNQEEFGTNKNLYLAKISEAANSLFYETKDFIWSIDPGNDTVYDVLVYIKDFGDDFFTRSGIAFKVDEIGEEFKGFVLPMKWKREIILIFKEAMNNVMKHSKASVVELKANVSSSILTMSLFDDGIGFNIKEHDSNGRGLTSIRKRTEVVGGIVKVESDSEGTCVQLSLKTKEVKK